MNTSKAHFQHQDSVVWSQCYCPEVLTDELMSKRSQFLHSQGNLTHLSVLWENAIRASHSLVTPMTLLKISWLICGQFLHKPHPCGIPLRTSETNQRNSVLKWKGCTNFTKEYTAKREGVCLLQEVASACPFMQGKNLKTLSWCHQLQFLHGWSTMDREMAASRNSFTLFHVVSAHSTWVVLICLVSKLITLQASAHWSTARRNMHLSPTTKILLLQASYHSFTTWQLWKTLFYNNDQVCMSTELVCCPAKRRNTLKFVQIDHCQGVVRDPAHNARVAV